jgi:hypothetical protein
VGAEPVAGISSADVGEGPLPQSVTAAAKHLGISRGTLFLASPVFLNRVSQVRFLPGAPKRVVLRVMLVGRMDDPVGYLYRTAMNLFLAGYGEAKAARMRPSFASTIMFN